MLIMKALFLSVEDFLPNSGGIQERDFSRGFWRNENHGASSGCSDIFLGTSFFF